MAFWDILGNRVYHCLKLSCNIFLDKNILHKSVRRILYTLLCLQVMKKGKVMWEAEFIHFATEETDVP